MCGICGYASNGQPVAPALREMLGVMEKHRLGFESAGIATVHRGKILYRKDVGSVYNVFPVNGSWSKLLLGSVGIGHVRYPSPKAPTGKGMFAHPFLSCNGKTILVHNGTIYNYDEIFCELHGHQFSSLDKSSNRLNDSEVIVHLLEQEIDKAKGDIIEGIKKTCRRLAENPKNQFLFAFIHLNEQSKVYVVSGKDYEDKRKVAVAYKQGFGSVFASYRDKGINKHEPVKFEALKPHINFESDQFEILNYGTAAILTKTDYHCFKLKT